MSSILEALKKVEQEAAVDGGGAPPPWPAPLPVRTIDRRRHPLWWLWLGLVGGCCMAAVAFWMIRRPVTTQPEGAQKFVQPAAIDRSEPAMKAEKPVLSALGSGSEASSPPAEPQPQPIQTAEKPLQAVPPVADPIEPPSSRPIEKKVSEPAMSNREPTTAPPATGSRPVEAAVKPRQSAPTPKADTKQFRNDSRIELQALVWAPAAGDRFVVINNRLIKEGGSIDTIVVVQINRDDVLLAEGSNRWHQEFKIR